METTLQEAYDLLVDAFEHAMIGDQDYAMMLADLAGVTRLRQFQIRQKVEGGVIVGGWESGYEAGIAEGWSVWGGTARSEEEIVRHFVNWLAASHVFLGQVLRSGYVDTDKKLTERLLNEYVNREGTGS